MRASFPRTRTSGYCITTLHSTIAGGLPRRACGTGLLIVQMAGDDQKRQLVFGPGGCRVGSQADRRQPRR